MVLAILAGRKTQTRRVVNPQPRKPVGPNRDGLWSNTKDPVTRYFGCPHGRIGDQLWVKETLKRSEDGLWGQYAADGEWVVSRPPFAPLRQCWHSRTDKSLSKSNRPSVPSIHMPRRACRITLELSALRIERLQDISEADAIAEGLYPNPQYTHAELYTWDGVQGNSNNPRYAYQLLWESINGANSWAENPWVWVETFKQVFNAELSGTKENL